VCVEEIPKPERGKEKAGGEEPHAGDKKADGESLTPARP